MGVPNTNTFTLADVVAVVNPTTNDLQDCFNDASTAAFNTTYDENKDQLDDFRDYGNNGSSQSQVTIANNNYSNSNVCTQSQSYSCYKSGSTAIFENGNKIWYDTGSGPGSSFAGNTSVPDLEWYSGGSGVSKVKFQINSSGVIYNVEACNPYRTLPDVQYITGYNGGVAILSTKVDYYYDNSIGDAVNLAGGDIIYTDTTLLSPLTANTGPKPLFFIQWTYTATSTDLCQDILNSPGGHLFLTNGTDGVISGTSCSYL
jgi:hypothetical protein